MSRKTRKELHNLMKEDQDLLKSLVQMAMQEVLVYWPSVNQTLGVEG